MKRLILFLVLAGALAAQYVTSVPQTIADITGTGATVQLLAASTNAQWVQFGALPTNTANVRWGDSNTAISRGMFIAPGGGQFLSKTNTDLSQVYVFIGSGDKVSVTWGK